MKKIVFILCVFFSCFLMYGEPQYLGKEYSYVYETGYICIYEDYIDSRFKHASKHSLDMHTIEKGRLYQTKYFDVFEGEERKYIILNCTVQGIDFLTPIRKDQNTKNIYGCFERPHCDTRNNSSLAGLLASFSVKKAESYITEKDKDGNDVIFFPSEDMLFDLSENPWAVKKDAKKIITLGTKRYRDERFNYFPINEMIFINGFVFPDKDYLYEQNSRAKRIRITYDKTSFETELKDTGNYQVVNLPAEIDPQADNNIEVEILDYYPGSKYSDVVISGIYYLDAIVN